MSRRIRACHWEITKIKVGKVSTWAAPSQGGVAGVAAACPVLPSLRARGRSAVSLLPSLLASTRGASKDLPTSPRAPHRQAHLFFYPFGPFDPFDPALATPKKSRRRRSETHLPPSSFCPGQVVSRPVGLPRFLLRFHCACSGRTRNQFPAASSAVCVQPQTAGLRCTMDSQETPARRHGSDRSKPKFYRTGQIRHYSTPAQGLNHVIAGSLDNSKETLLQGWLNNIQALGSGLDAGGPPARKPSNSNRLLRPQSVSPARWAPNALPRSRASGIAEPMSQPSGERRHRRPRASFDGPSGPDDRDDSSVIAPRPFSDNPRARRPNLKSAAYASGYERGKKRRQSGRDSQGSGSSPGPSPPEYNFEKRARHKTKSDRYDTVKQHDAERDHKSKKRKTRSAAEPRRTRQRNSHLASAKEVMDKFTSHSILSDRITVSLPQPSPQARLIELERCHLLVGQGCLTMVGSPRSQVSPARRPTASRLSADGPVSHRSHVP